MKVWSIGNGQVCQLGLSPIMGTLNCMHDPMAILIEEDKCRPLKNNPTAYGQNQINQQPYTHKQDK